MYLFKGHPSVINHARRQRGYFGRLHISAVTYYEVYKGWSYNALSPDTDKRRFARRKLVDFEVFVSQNTLLNLTFDAVQHAGIIQSTRRCNGLSYDDDLDYLIAGIALANGCTLVTQNVSDFAGIAGLRVENWLESSKYHEPIPT